MIKINIFQSKGQSCLAKFGGFLVNGKCNKTFGSTAKVFDVMESKEIRHS